MKHYIIQIFLLFTCFVLVIPVRAMTKAEADKAYREKKYQQAIKDYESLLRSGVSASLYYNLGNAYYRTDNITKAILNYERAALLEPGNSDIKFNLQFARSKTIDKFSEPDEMFFVTWYRAMVNFTSVDGWAAFSIIAVVLALIGFLIYLFVNHIILRKMGFFVSLACLLLFVLSILFAIQQKSAFENRNGAIIIAPTVCLKKTPVKNSADVVVVHEGTKVNITDRGIKGWYNVRLPDGHEGWLSVASLEEI